MKLYSPNNTEILGTYESIFARAEISNVSRGDDGKLELDFDYTEVFWETSTTQREDGERLFLDRAGEVFKESELEIREDDE